MGERAKKFNIEVRKDGKPVEEVNRVLTGAMVGNFNPIYAKFKGEDYLVQSEEGGLDNPLRRDKKSLEKLFIDLKK